MKRAARRAAPPWEGALLGQVDGTVWGWARTGGGECVVVELLGDGEPLALARSGMILPDACGQPADRAHCGFVAVLGAERLRGVGRMEARIANTAHVLDGTIFPSQQASSPPVTFGSVDARDGLRVHGWILPDPLSDEPTVVLAFVGGRCVAECLIEPDDARPPPADAPASARTFDFTLPLSLADGRPHRVSICAGHGGELPGSPFTVHLPSQGDRRWIQQLPLAPSDREALLAMSDRWRARVPQSLGWSAYAAWKARFGCAPAPVSLRRVVVVVCPAAETSLDATLASLMAQMHENYRVLVRAPDAPDRVTHPSPGGLPADPRLRLIRASDWEEVLADELSQSEFASFIQGGDQWHPDLLRHALHALESGADACYCDAEDLSGGPPWFKPDWCLDTFLALPLLDHGFVCRSALLADPAPDPADWPWQAVASARGAARVAHVAHALHLRGDGLPASSPRAPSPSSRGPAPRASGLDRAALAVHGFGVKAWTPDSRAGHPAPNRVTWPDPQSWPTVCLIVPTRDRHDLLRTCLDSLRLADYPALSICVLDNQTVCEKTLAYLEALERDGIQVLRWPHAFNYAGMHNFAIERLEADVIGFVNNDIRALESQWLRHMVRQLIRPDVGAVGAKLLWPNRMVQHAGVVLGLHGAAGHAGCAWSVDDEGYHHTNQISRGVSAVTAACMLIRRSDYLAAGGMDAQRFPVAFNDVDLCLRLRERGKRIIWAADAVLEHAESMTRGADDSPARLARASKERSALEARWGTLICADPHYNPNLNLDRYAYDGLAFPPRHSG